MDFTEPVKAISRLRHYQEVAHSNFKRFGADNPYRDLQPICNNYRVDWRYRGAATETRESGISLLSERLSLIDAAAPFWLTRDQLAGCPEL